MVVSRFKSALNWNQFLGDLRRDLNALNSDTVYATFAYVVPNFDPEKKYSQKTT